ncbi:MAG: redoxin domain-containing protein [Pseudomonadales bacterium]|nr:redoxin domain-containing protein [Pseudomonadales bacterium]
MKRSFASLSVFLLSLLFTTLLHAAPEIGDPAPEFSLPGSDGKNYTLSQFRGKQWVAIAFFPKAFTGG